MLDLDEPDKLGGPSPSKPAFRQRKSLGRKRQRDEVSDAVKEELKPEDSAKDDLPPGQAVRKQRKFASQDTTTRSEQRQEVAEPENDRAVDDAKHEDSHGPSATQNTTTTLPKPTQNNRSTVKAPPKSIRTATITDFQPDVCKDFHQTGFCGYGDTCKFLHIRDELRATKPVVKDWKVERECSIEDIPFKCVLCKQDYQRPVKTECGHIFCQSCFMRRYRAKKPTCFICGKDTGGLCVPVSTKELQKLLPVPGPSGQ